MDALLAFYTFIRLSLPPIFLSISFTVRNQFLWREDSWITLNFSIMLNSIYYLELDLFITLKKNYYSIILDSVWRSLWIAADFNDILVQHNISKSLALSHTRLDRLLLRQKFSVEGIQNSQAQQQRVLRGPQHCWPLIGQAGVITWPGY